MRWKEREEEWGKGGRDRERERERGGGGGGGGREQGERLRKGGEREGRERWSNDHTL